MKISPWFHSGVPYRICFAICPLRIHSEIFFRDHFSNTFHKRFFQKLDNIFSRISGFDCSKNFSRNFYQIHTELHSGIPSEIRLDIFFIKNYFKIFFRNSLSTFLTISCCFYFQKIAKHLQKCLLIFFKK